MTKEPIRIKAPFDDATARSLRAGDTVLISGTIIAARDAAHKRLTEALDRGEQLPVDLTGAVIYYVGPSPAKPGQVIGSAGPTTSGRMDAYTPRILDQGVKGMIGKGYRKPEVVEAMNKNPPA
jgi:fumarate hydratase subunit beta